MRRSLRVVSVVVHPDPGRGLAGQLTQLTVEDAVRDVALLRVEVLVVLGPHHRIWGEGTTWKMRRATY